MVAQSPEHAAELFVIELLLKRRAPDGRFFQ